MSVRYLSGLAPITIPAEDERYPTQAACQVRCDELTAAVSAAREAKQADQRMYGYCHVNGLTSGDYVRYIPSQSLGGSYWSPRLVLPPG